MITIPLRTDDLITWLDEQYPPRCIGEKETAEVAHRYAGKRELIDRLKGLLQIESDQAARLNRRTT